MFRRFLPTNAMVLALLLVMILSCTVGASIFGKLNELSPAAQERQRLEAQEWKERAEAERPVRLFWAWVQVVLAALIIVGVVLVAILYGVRKALTIAPDERGIFPMLLGRVDSAWVVHNQNKELAATTSIGPGDVRVIHHLPPGMETQQVQITSQAQAIQALAAAAASSSEGSAGQKARELVSSLVSASQLTKPLPAVRRSPWESSHVERLLIEAGELEEASDE